MVDDVADSADLLAALGVDRFVTVGWSGGGPRALGCAALLPGVPGRRSIAGVGAARRRRAGLEGRHGPRERRGVHRGRGRPRGLRAYLEAEFLPVLLADADDMADAMGGLLPPVTAPPSTGRSSSG